MSTDKACVPRTYEGERTLSIHQLPKKWQDFDVANREFFDDLGAPGGAAELGRPDPQRRGHRAQRTGAGTGLARCRLVNADSDFR